MVELYFFFNQTDFLLNEILNYVHIIVICFAIVSVDYHFF